MSKILVAYFSASGSTSKLAQTLAAAANADLYEIRPAVPYEKKDLNWMDKKARSTLEMQDPGCRPELADTAAPVADADVVYDGENDAKEGYADKHEPVELFRVGLCATEGECERNAHCRNAEQEN